jgi:Zn-dependent M28 family amino/carboxypeptidase
MQKPSSDKESTTPRAKLARTAFTFLLILTLPLLFVACPGGDKKGNANQSANVTPASTPTPTPSQAKLSIDGERAFEHVRKQVEIGPRPAGSAELAKARDYIVGELNSYGLNVTLDEFTPKTPVGDRKMVNVTAELPGESSDVIIVSSHYDTKLFKEFRFVGANDGGSSTGTLLEMARIMAQSGQKPRFTYWFVFFDGEEAFCTEWEQCKNPDGPDNTYGSRHYVKQLKERNELKNRVRAMILLDMMGYKNLRLGRDEEMSTPILIEEVWQTASELGYGAQFVDEEEGVGGDDHEPFLKEGIPSLDIIQLSTYEYWHKPEDTLDKISPQSLKIVGDVVLNSLPRIEQRLINMRPPS